MPTAPEEAPNSTGLVELADTLEQAGRFHDAAQALERLPRQGRDPLVDVRIVRLRHLAFAELADTQPSDLVPSGTPVDHWPDSVGAPEIPAGDLTVEKLRSAVYHHGCLVVRGLLPADECAQLRSDIDLAFDAVDNRMPYAPVTPTEWYAPFPAEPPFEAPDPLGTAFLRSAGGVYASYAPRAFVDYRNALARAGLVDVVGQYLQGVPVLSVNKFVLRRINGGAEPAWHQDGLYLRVEGSAVNLWLSLSECGADTDVMGLDILPGRRAELAEVGTHGAADRRAVAPKVAERLAQESGRRIERPLFHEGDGILFDQFFIHRSDVRPLARDRYAIESWFFSAQGYPQHLIPVVAG